jgi:hypothetical protein
VKDTSSHKGCFKAFLIFRLRGQFKETKLSLQNPVCSFNVFLIDSSLVAYFMGGLSGMPVLTGNIRQVQQWYQIGTNGFLLLFICISRRNNCVPEKEIGLSKSVTDVSK